MNVPINNLGFAVGTFFHLFMIFLVIYSSVAIFALLRFGQSRIIALATCMIYGGLIGSLYLQTLYIINQL